MNYQGMNPLMADIRQMIEEKIEEGYKKYIIFPFGDVGMRVKEILNISYGINEDDIIDNKLYRYNSKIKKLFDFNEKENLHEYAVLLASTNKSIYNELKKDALNFFGEKQLAELPSMKKQEKEKWPEWHTSVGKYSYGPICRNHRLIKSIGAFCSFAEGVDVVPNHEVDFITTHPMLYNGKQIKDYEYDYNIDRGGWYFPGVQPLDIVKKWERCTIGNDVWLGKNVTITKCANIGNGVIAGAGAVITKDIPDYAVVVGVPARIIRYRYSKDQIDALNRIEWWNWSDEEIRERYNDFYLPIDAFIKKWDKKIL